MSSASLHAPIVTLILAVLLSGCTGPSRLAFDPSTGGVQAKRIPDSLPSKDSLFNTCSGVQLGKGVVEIQCTDVQRFWIARYDATVSEKKCRGLIQDIFRDVKLHQGPALSFADSSLTFAFVEESERLFDRRSFVACAPHQERGLGLYAAQGGLTFDSSFSVKGLSVLAYEGAPKERVTARRPKEIPLLGRRLKVHSSCEFKGAQNLSCYPNGQMNWATFSSVERAEETVKKQIERSRNLADEILSDTTVACTFEGVDTECRRVAYRGPALTKVSTFLTGGSNVLVAFYATAEVRGRPAHAVCSFWRDQATPNGLAALCRESFEVPNADSMLKSPGD